MNKLRALSMVTIALLSSTPLLAANFDSTTHIINLNNIQGVDNNATTFNTAITLHAQDNDALHKGQVFTFANPGVAIGSPDARYTVADNKLLIPTLLVDGGTLVQLTLQLTNPAKSELTVLDVASLTVGAQGPKGDKGDLGPQGPKGDTGPQGPAGKDGASSQTQGTAAGDIQYWDGSKWSLLTGGSNGKYLVFCDGKLVWGTCATNPTPTPTPQPSGTYKIGGKGPAGGIVFMLDAAKEHGVEAKDSDYKDPGQVTWPQAVLAAESYGAGWRLPTKEELLQMYFYNVAIGNNSTDYFWTSTEDGANAAIAGRWYNGSNGNQSSYSKTRTFYVRAVRSF